MNITSVTVTIHEKRAHPHAMGHKDCEVSLTAELEPGDIVFNKISELRYKANSQVETELDKWIDGIKEEQKLAVLRFDLAQKLRSVRNASSPERLEETRLDAITTIQLLNVEDGAEIDEQDEAYRKLAACVGVATKNMQENGGESEIPF
jgi:hypothetical protein